MDPQQIKKVRIARLSIISNTTLMILKLITGFVIGSVSIISEAIHSGVDLVAAIIAYAAVKTSGKPADYDHPFGHGKIENISGTVEALLIFLAAGWIIYEAVKKIINPTPIEALSWGVGVMLFSSIINWIVSHMLFTVGEETDSIALKADAWHLRTDVYTSVGVMCGLFIIWGGRYFSPDLSLQWIDPIAALAVAILIIRTSYKLTVQSARDLMDMKLPADEENYIRNLIASMYPKVHGYHRLRTRKAGSNRFIEFHMKVAPDMTVEDSHAITHEIKQQIVEHFSESSVTIHVEPCDGKCQNDCLKHCLLSEEEQKKVRRQTDFQKH